MCIYAPYHASLRGTLRQVPGNDSSPRQAATRTFSKPLIHCGMRSRENTDICESYRKTNDQLPADGPQSLMLCSFSSDANAL